MSHSPKNTIMDNSTMNSSKDTPLPPCRPPVLLRQNATWDDESMENERKRVKQILASMGIPENYNHGG